MGRRVTARHNRPQQRLDAVVASCFKQSRIRPSCFPCALETCPARTLPQTLISRRGPCAVHAGAVRSCSAAMHPRRTCWPTEAIGSGSPQLVFRPAVAA